MNSDLCFRDTKNVVAINKYFIISGVLHCVHLKGLELQATARVIPFSIKQTNFMIKY